MLNVQLQHKGWEEVADSDTDGKIKGEVRNLIMCFYGTTASLLKKDLDIGGGQEIGLIAKQHYSITV